MVVIFCFQATVWSFGFWTLHYPFIDLQSNKVTNRSCENVLIVI